MVIGINGKIGAGKDTVGNIIQYLTDKNIKDMSFEYWYASNAYSVYQATGKWEIKKFAGKLKTIASMLTGIPVEKFEDQEFKKTNLPEHWNTLQQSGRNKVSLPMTVRELLQKLGTEAMRDRLHTNVWVNALFADYHPTPNKSIDESFKEQFVTGRSEIHYKLPNWIITDMRFPNELEAVKKKNGISIRVERNNATNIGIQQHIKISDKINNTKEHESETALDNAEFDYIIINNGTIEELIQKIKEILIKENIIS